MPYVPNNTAVYLKACAGFMAGITAPAVSDTTAADYAQYAQMADVWAQAVDTAWGAPAPTSFEASTIETVSEAIWLGRSPPAGSLFPSSYTQVAAAVVARVRQANAQVVSEGINPDTPSPPLSAATLMIRIPIGLVTVSSGASIPVGSVVESAKLDIETAYSLGTSISLGQAGTPTAFMVGGSSGDNTPTSIGLYINEEDVIAASSGPLLVTITGATSVGGGFAIVKYTTAPST